MPLTTYQQKRHFTQTPEPKGARAKAGGLRFVVQKHDASHLHYDVRLEWDGALKSWAVPRGPSLNPHEKRLAMMTEDHPLDYRKFEGVIPPGNYGAGTVMVWDEGTYRVPGVDGAKETEAMRAGFHKGEIHVEFHGQKLRGVFLLIKLRNTKDENAWLLMKKQDGAATKTDILEQDRSALSGRSLEEIASTIDASRSLVILKKGQRSAMPTRVEPMLAKLVDQPFDDNRWAYEIKWDGYRIIAYKKGKKVTLKTRHQQNYTEAFQIVADELATLDGDFVLDGEMVVLDDQGIPRFQLMQNFLNGQRGSLVYEVFDVLYAKGRDLRSLPLEDRKLLLRSLLPTLDHVKLGTHIIGNGKAFFEAASAKGLEGIVAKRLDSRYLEGSRSEQWLKIKAHQRQEAVIGGYTEGRGGRKQFGALVLGVYDGDKFVYIGHTGGGFDDASLKAVKKRLSALETTRSPFVEAPKTNAPVHWVKPRLVCEVKFSEWTDDGHMRQPIFLGLREDKEAREVKREVPEHVAPVIPPGRKVYAKDTPKHEDAKHLTINGRALEVTHWHKTFFPEDRITKGDLVEYYRSIVKWILPYLKDRPESMNRFPHGINENHFYQKDAPDVLEWVPRVTVHSEGEERDLEYVLCNDEATLVYLVQLGCIEFNPWNSRVGSLETPDYLVLDLDPEDIAFDEVVVAAQAAKKVLDGIKAPAFCKTSGATGLHIYVPLAPRYSYDQVRSFAEVLAHKINQLVPRTTSLERSPSRRQKKVYLDYLQNRRGQTMAAPYAVRPRPGATVSTPLKWTEVRKGLDPRKFTLRNTKTRIERLGDLWVPTLKGKFKIEEGMKRL